MKLKILLDTNIVIPLEPTAPADLEANSAPALLLANFASLGGHHLYVHPEILADIARDRDVARRQLRTLLVRRYPALPDPPARSQVEAKLGLSTVSPNDAVDNALLAAVHADAVDYLVTEDGGLHRKARRLGLSDRVILIASAIDLLRDLHDVHVAPPPFVESIKAHALDTGDPIFDSFRQDYDDFDAWLSKVRREHRDAWRISSSDGGYAAVTIVKSEDGSEVGIAGKVLKVCSFKVAPTANGTKFGELLLKVIFEHARANRCDAIYVTVFPHHAALVVLLRQFGFLPLEERSTRGEDVLVKMLKADLAVIDALEFHVRFGPGKVRSYVDQPAYVVPIQPEYHDALFPDARLLARQPALSGLESPKPYGSAIRKAYLCHAPIRKLSQGDNLFFYRSRDSQSIACTGVVEDTLVSSDPARIARFVGVRTVYKYEEIEVMAGRRDVLAIMFRHDRSLSERIRFEDLRANNVLKAAPQSILSVSASGRQWLAMRFGAT